MLPGFVVPAIGGRWLVEEAAGVAETDGLHAAQLLVLSSAAIAAWIPDVVRRGRALGEWLVVRSSATVEADPSWAGAFSSLVGVRPDELPTAVLACWASTFSPRVAARCSRAGIQLRDACPAALVQPLVEAVASGVARTGVDGSVSLVAVRGPPAHLLSGHVRGESATVGHDDVAAGPALGSMGRSLLLEVAALGRMVTEDRPTMIEWAAAPEGITLLQVGPAPPLTAPRVDRAGTVRSFPRHVSDLAVRMAYLVADFAGPLGEALVLPWRPAIGDLDVDLPAARPTRADAVRAWDLATSKVAGLSAIAWAAGPRQAMQLSARALDSLAAGASAVAIESFARLAPIDPRAAAEALSLLGLVEVYLHEAGGVAGSTRLWALDPDDVPGLLAGGIDHRPSRPPRPTLRWQRLLQSAVATSGATRQGEGSSPGQVAGLARFSSTGPEDVSAGEILVVSLPLSTFSPLLWVAGGLVSLGGSPAAHLFEVARSLRVPAVVSIHDDLTGPGLADQLVLLDGTHGTLTNVTRPSADHDHSSPVSLPGSGPGQ